MESAGDHFLSRNGFDITRPPESFEQECAEVVCMMGVLNGRRKESVPWAPNLGVGTFDRARVVSNRYARLRSEIQGEYEGVLDEAWSMQRASVDFCAVDLSTEQQALPCAFGAATRDGLWFQRARSRPLAQVACRMTRASEVGPHVLEVAELHTASNAKKRLRFSLLDYQLVAETRDGRMVDCTRRREIGTGFRKRSDESCLMLSTAVALLSLEERYDWSVCIGRGDSPTIAVPVERESAKAVFRLRDMPEGASRRKALLHFVEQHWRRGRRTTRADYREADTASVRAYIRGESVFAWNGLRCEIVPPAYDVERVLKAAADH